MTDDSISVRGGFGKSMGGRLLIWLKDLPEFWRPVAFGALFIVAYAVAYGGLIVIPITVVAICFTSATPLADLGRLTTILMFALLGGGLSGLSYSLLGRRLRGIRWIGPYVSGMITVIPYAILLDFIGRVQMKEPLFAPFGPVEWVVPLIVTVVAGASFGSAMFGPERAPAVITGGREVGRVAVILACGAAAIFIVWAMCYPPLCWLGGRYCR